MFASLQPTKSAPYTSITLLLVMAFVFTPAILVASMPMNGILLSLGIALSILCSISAWYLWSTFSALPVPSIVNESRRQR